MLSSIFIYSSSLVCSPLTFSPKIEVVGPDVAEDSLFSLTHMAITITKHSNINEDSFFLTYSPVLSGQISMYSYMICKSFWICWGLNLGPFSQIRFRMTL